MQNTNQRQVSRGHLAGVDMALCLIVGLVAMLVLVIGHCPSTVATSDLFGIAILIFLGATLVGFGIFAMIRIVLPAAMRPPKERAQGWLVAIFAVLHSLGAQCCPGGLRRPPRYFS